ncbi:MAG: response regulator, partial [Acidobacteria bacterium]|nr:response regulator [Acidobacteriota bacterium]
VVDDEPFIPDLIEEILSAQGHRVTKATNGNQAVELLASQRFDLILSDLRMPGLDGMGLYREIRRRWPELLGRLVFITGDQANEETKAFLAGIGSRFIGKPFSLADLRKVVEEISPGAPSGPRSDRASAA